MRTSVMPVAVAMPSNGLRSLSARSNVWSAYCKKLQTHPLETKALTSMVGFGLGDVIAQVSSSGLPFPANVCSIDYARTAKMAAWGGAVAGPIGHYWFGLLDKVLWPEKPAGAAAVASKCAADQLLMAPFGLVLFYTYMMIVNGQAPVELMNVLSSKFAPTLLANYKLWPLAHAVNFSIVPAEHRILYVNAISILWCAILSATAS